MAWGLNIRKYIVENCRTFIVIILMKKYTEIKTAIGENLSNRKGNGVLNRFENLTYILLMVGTPKTTYFYINITRYRV